MTGQAKTELQPTSASNARSAGLAALLLFLFVLFCDQILKIWIKTHFTLGEEHEVIPNFFYIHFTENYGMAFGMELEGNYGKLILSLFRIFAVAGITWYLLTLIRNQSPKGLILCLSLILAGALGNILDSAFYGLWFSESTLMDVSEFLPDGGGYAGFLHGAVVDMFYFNTYIESVFWSDDPFVFSFPIFNISDSAITVGVILIFIFQRRFFPPAQSEIVKSQEVKADGEA